MSAHRAGFMCKGNIRRITADHTVVGASWTSLHSSQRHLGEDLESTVEIRLS